MVKYTKQAEQSLVDAAAMANKLGLEYVGTEHLLLGLLSAGSGIAGIILRRNEIYFENILRIVENIVKRDGGIAIKYAGKYTPKLDEVLRVAQSEAMRAGASCIGTEHILLGLLEVPDAVAFRIICSFDVNPQEMINEIRYVIDRANKTVLNKNNNGANGINNLKRNSESGYNGDRTPTLDKFSRNLTLLAQNNELDPIIGREYEMERIIHILSRRTKNNPCLLGEPGVGKTAIVEGLAQKIVSGEVPDTLQGKRLVTLDLTSTIAGTKYRGEFEERIKTIIDEVAKAKNVLLFIDEIHTIIGAGSAEGTLDASNILKPYLARGEIQIIGATTIDEYRKRIEKDPAFERRFQPVYVEEPSEDETVELLSGIKHQYEDFHNVNITDEAVNAAVTFSVRYINDRFLPDKAIDVLDEAAAKVKLVPRTMPKALVRSNEKLQELKDELNEYVSKSFFSEVEKVSKKLEKEQKKNDKLLSEYKNDKEKSRPFVTEDDVAAVVSRWTKIPVSRLETNESKRLVKLEDELHKRVIGQNEAVSGVSKAIRRGRLGIKDPKRPTGSFMFLGPTGVGKTELSKALAECVFGSEDSIIRVDMSEFMESHSVSKMVGSPPGYVGFEDGGQLSEKVRRNPYSVVLFDEIEKAHPDVFNILLQVLDDGVLTDAKGRKVSFKNTVIIMTSNAGASRIIEPKHLGFSSEDDEKRDYEKMKSDVMEEVNRLFKPEFINRIDEIVVFHQLTKDEVKKIVNIMLKNVSSVVKEQLGINLKYTATLKNHLLEKGFDKKFGARPMRRTIQTLIEDELTDSLLKGQIERDSDVTVSIADGKVTFTGKKETAKTSK